MSATVPFHSDEIIAAAGACTSAIGIATSREVLASPARWSSTAAVSPLIAASVIRTQCRVNFT